MWQAYKEKGVQVLGINIQESAVKVKSWIAAKQVTYPVLLDENAAIWVAFHNANWYIPHNVVIDTGMVVRYSNFGYNEAAILSTIQAYLPTGVADNPAVPPRTHAIFRAYPNPFRQSTRIRTVLPRSSEFEIVIFDLQGREIRRFHGNGNAAAPVEFIWDGRSDSGSKVPAGMYFAQLRYGTRLLQQKLLILK